MLRGDLIQQFKLAKVLETIGMKQAQIPSHLINASCPAYLLVKN
jgi:hypothetical protein